MLDLVRQGSVTFEQASADPRYWRIPVVRLLIAVPGIGKMKATQLMAQAGISPNRRVKGLGCRQRDYIIEHLPASKARTCPCLRHFFISRRSYQAMPPPWPYSFVLGWRRGCGVVSLVFDRFYFTDRVSRFPDTPFV